MSPEGKPQSALVGIAVTPNLEIVFDTVATSRKVRNLAANPRCSFVVGWENEVTVQLEGEAHQPEGAELAAYQQDYFAHWPSGLARRDWPGITNIVVRPTWVFYSDFHQAPPLIAEFGFEQRRRCDGRFEVSGMGLTSLWHRAQPSNSTTG